MVRIVVALPCEARPLISHWALQAVCSGGDFRVYGAPGLRLVVSGVGKAASSAAVSSLHAGLPPGPAAWLNVGVAGHSCAPVGTPFLARTITDGDTGVSHRPSFCFPLPCGTAPVLTVDEPLDLYPDAALCEMEASGFFAAAQDLTSSDLVHCMKIVSDGPGRTWRELTADRIAALLEQNAEVVDTVVRALNARVAERVGRTPCP